MDTVTQKAADQARGIPLGELLDWHGFKITKEGASIRARSEDHNIVVTGNKWFDNKSAVGGAGAIDLQMHLGGEDCAAACRTLLSRFSPSIPPRSGIECPAERPSPRLPFPELMAKYAVRDDSNWPAARAYLVETRKIEPSLVDEMHGRGSIFANAHRPNPSLVFLHRTDSGKVVGATLRDTRPDSSFRPTLGDKLSAWFVVGTVKEAETIVAVESPIDALSYHTLFAGRNDALAVVSCSGATVPGDLLWQTYDRRQRLVVGLDNDRAGELGWQKAWDETSDWTGFKISSACPRLKDWNADLQASCQTHSVQPRTSLKL